MLNEKKLIKKTDVMNHISVRLCDHSIPINDRNAKESCTVDHLVYK